MGKTNPQGKQDGTTWQVNRRSGQQQLHQDRNLRREKEGCSKMTVRLKTHKSLNLTYRRTTASLASGSIRSSPMQIFFQAEPTSFERFSNPNQLSNPKKMLLHKLSSLFTLPSSLKSQIRFLSLKYLAWSSRQVSPEDRRRKRKVHACPLRREVGRKKISRLRNY